MALPGGKDGKRALFEQQALPHLNNLYAAALHLTRNADGAADLLQETTLRAYRFFHQFTPGTNCRAWLMTILYNTFRNRHRQIAREKVSASPEDFEHELDLLSFRDGNGHNPERLVADRVLAEEVQAALDSLPEEFRAALLLVDLHELTYHEAAEALDVPIGTVRSRLSRARGMLKRYLTEYARSQGYIRRKGAV